MRLLFFAVIFFAESQGHSIKNTLLQENKDWVDPRNILGPSRQADGNEATFSEPTNEDVELLRKALKVCERSLNQCSAELVQYQMASTISDGGRLSMDMIYLRRFVSALVQKVGRRSWLSGNSPARMEIPFSTEDVESLKQMAEQLDSKTVLQLDSKLADLLQRAEIKFENGEEPSRLSTTVRYVNDLLLSFDLMTTLQASIPVLFIVAVIISLTSRSKVVKISSIVLYIFWISYLWHWLNLLKKSEADKFLLGQKNPCEETRAWYNVMRYISSENTECAEYIRKQLTAGSWEYSPLEVLLHMVAELTSKSLSVAIANTLSGVGTAIREFSDKQSWFSVVPAFALLFFIMMTVLFKASGMAFSLFGMRLESSTPVHRVNPPEQRWAVPDSSTPALRQGKTRRRNSSQRNTYGDCSDHEVGYETANEN